MLTHLQQLTEDIQAEEIESMLSTINIDSIGAKSLDDVGNVKVRNLLVNILDANSEPNSPFLQEDLKELKTKLGRQLDQVRSMLQDLSELKTCADSKAFDDFIRERREKGGGTFLALIEGLSLGDYFESGSQLPVRITRTDAKYQVGDLVVFKIDDSYIAHVVSAVHENLDGSVTYKTQGLNRETNPNPDSWELSGDQIVGIADFSEEFLATLPELASQGLLLESSILAMTKLHNKLTKLISSEISKGTHDISTLTRELFPSSDHVLEFLGLREDEYRYRAEFLPRFIDFLKAIYNIGDIKGISYNDLEYLKFDLLGQCFSQFFKKGLTINTLIQLGVPRDIITFATVQNFPPTWSIFKSENNYEFYKTLIEFQGNDLDLDYDKKLGGGEGKIFLSSKHSDKVIKRWFSSQLFKFDKSIDLLEGARRMIENDPELNKYIEVVKIYEMGNDWILRDYYEDSIELKEAIIDSNEASLAFQEVLKLLRSATDSYLQKVYERFNRAKPSSNLHWDADLNKIIIIDMM